MYTQCEFSTANGKSFRRLLYHPKRQHTVLPCMVCSNRHCHQICTIPEPKCPLQVSERVTCLRKQDNLMWIQGIRSICPKSGPERHRLLDNSVQTSSFYHKRTCLSYTRRPCNLLVMACVSKSEFHLLPLHSTQIQRLKRRESLGL